MNKIKFFYPRVEHVVGEHSVLVFSLIHYTHHSIILRGVLHTTNILRKLISRIGS